MKKYSLVTTHYCTNCSCSSKEELIQRFNYDGSIDDLYINFSNKFDPWNVDNINIGNSGRKDLIYGKIFLLKEFIENNLLNKYEYICHIDYSDTKFSKSFIEMMQDFEYTKQDFIISSEKNCWPNIDIVQKWVKYPLENKDFEYLNSGAVISKTQVYYEYLKELIDICLSTPIDFWDDQGVWQYYNLNVNRLNIDKNCKYFFSTGLLDNTYFNIDNDKKITTKFNTHPYLIHDNSSFSLNLINKI